jgi:hypothetical protein
VAKTFMCGCAAGVVLGWIVLVWVKDWV